MAEYLAFAMLLAPAVVLFGMLLLPLFKTFDRKCWMIFGGVIAWYLVAFFLLLGIHRG